MVTNWQIWPVGILGVAAFLFLATVARSARAMFSPTETGTTSSAHQTPTQNTSASAETQRLAMIARARSGTVSEAAK